MPTLLLLRHAKSSWDDPGLADFDRPLAPRGIKSLPAMARLVLCLPLAPDLIVSSPARRAQQTAEGVRNRLAGENVKVPLALDARIYEAYCETLYEVVRELDPDNECVMIVGHNPGFEELVCSLCAAGSQANVRFPTAALAHVELHVPGWRHVQPGTGVLEGFYASRVLRRLQKSRS